MDGMVVSVVHLSLVAEVLTCEALFFLISEFGLQTERTAREVGRQIQQREQQVRSDEHTSLVLLCLFSVLYRIRIQTEYWTLASPGSSPGWRY